MVSVLVAGAAGTLGHKVCLALTRLPGVGTVRGLVRSLQPQEPSKARCAAALQPWTRLGMGLCTEQGPESLPPGEVQPAKLDGKNIIVPFSHPAAAKRSLHSTLCLRLSLAGWRPCAPRGWSWWQGT